MFLRLTSNQELQFRHVRGADFLDQPAAQAELWKSGADQTIERDLGEDCERAPPRGHGAIFLQRPPWRQFDYPGRMSVS
jgi:hypothetical protein